MDNYFVHIPGLPESLAKEEMQRNIVLMNEGNQESRQKLIEGNLRLIIHIINTRFQHYPFDKEEMFEIGCIGLIKGIDTYDINKNIELTTYIGRCIINEILMMARKNHARPAEESIDKPIAVNDCDSSDKSLMDVLESSVNLVEDYERKEEEFIVKEIIKELPDDYRLLIEMYFGINGQKRHTQRELAKHFNYSQSYISRIIKEVIAEIKEAVNEVNVHQLYHQSQQRSPIQK